MTVNMEMMYQDILTSLFNCFDQEYVGYLFGEFPIVSPIDFVDNIMLEFVKYSYYETVSRHPLRNFIPYSAIDGDHSERMRYARALKYTQKYKDFNYNLIGNQCEWNKEEMEYYEPLIAKDMSRIGSRIDGYNMTEMDFFEHTTIQELQIIKSYVENRLFSSKKVSNQKFIEMFDEYDAWVIKLHERSRRSLEDMVFSSIAYFTIEWKYAFEMIYQVAEKMIDNKTDEIDPAILRVLCKPLDYESQLGVKISGESRMIKDRQIFVNNFFEMDWSEAWTCYYMNKYAELVSFTSLYNTLQSIDECPYREWFKNNTNMEDWASFFEEYDVFESWNKKKWTNDKIRKTRMILEMLAPFPKNSLNPDFRA